MIEVLGKQYPRATVEALVEAMIAALDLQDGDIEAEAETDEDDHRRLEKAA